MQFIIVCFTCNKKMKGMKIVYKIITLTMYTTNYSLVPRPNRYRCVGIAWKTQSETRGRAWQKMQKKVYDSTKK